MKLVAIVGTNAEFSYNRLLLQWMRRLFSADAEIEVLEISCLPAFSRDLVTSEQDDVLVFAGKVEAADGVIVGSALVSLLESCGKDRARMEKTASSFVSSMRSALDEVAVSRQKG